MLSREALLFRVVSGACHSNALLS